MSVYVVEDETINKIITYLNTDRDTGECLRRKLKDEYGYDLEKESTRQLLGQAILNLNIAAVNVRYKQHGLMPSFRLAISPCTPIQAAKSLDCLIYQCSEGDIVNEPLYKLLEYISNVWHGFIVRRLPQWNVAVWG